MSKVMTKETQDGGILLKLVHEGILSGALAGELHERIAPYIAEHQVIEIDLNEVEQMDDEGYAHLSEIVKQANEADCFLTFMNVHEALSEIIDSFNLEEEG